jgi:hypothetical protein
MGIRKYIRCILNWGYFPRNNNSNSGVDAVKDYHSGKNDETSARLLVYKQ